MFSGTAHLPFQWLENPLLTHWSSHLRINTGGWEHDLHGLLARLKTRAVEPLIQSLKNPNWYIRWGAADALGKIGDNRALEPLTLLKDDDDDYVRRAGKEAIEKIRADNSNNTAWEGQVIHSIHLVIFL